MTTNKKNVFSLPTLNIFGFVDNVFCGITNEGSIRCFIINNARTIIIDLKDDIIERIAESFGNPSRIRTTHFYNNNIYYLNEELYVVYDQNGTGNFSYNRYYHSRLALCDDLVLSKQGLNFKIWLLNNQNKIFRVNLNNTFKFNSESEINLVEPGILLKKIVYSKNRNHFIFDKKGTVYDKDLNVVKKGNCESCKAFFIDDENFLYQIDGSNLNKIDIINDKVIKSINLTFENPRHFYIHQNNAILIKESNGELQQINIPL
jgi:hypothetical protein